MVKPRLVLRSLVGGAIGGVLLLGTLATALSPRVAGASGQPGMQGGDPASGVLPADPATLRISNSPVAGLILTDGAGRTLYLYTRDTRNTSNCYDACAVRWPPLLTSGTPVAGSGAMSQIIGTIQRRDGSTQAAYNGWPLYYYQEDAAPGDVKGQNVGGVWFVVSDDGGPRMNRAPVNLSGATEFGRVLVDSSGRTLYLYTRDEPNKSNCSGGCARTWPPLLSVGTAQAGEGVNAGLLGLTTREDGSTQVTYNGWPLYYYAPDEKPGDLKGQNVGGVWYVINAAGRDVRSAAAAVQAPRQVPVPRQAPAALPATGSGGLLPQQEPSQTGIVLGLAAIAVVFAGAGLAALRRRTR